MPNIPLINGKLYSCYKLAYIVLTPFYILFIQGIAENFGSKHVAAKLPGNGFDNPAPTVFHGTLFYESTGVLYVFIILYLPPNIVLVPLKAPANVVVAPQFIELKGFGGARLLSI